MGWLNCRCNGSPTPNEFPTYVPQLHILLLGHSPDMRCPQIEDEIRRWFIPTLQRFQEPMFQLLIPIPSVAWIVVPPFERLCRRAKLASKLCGRRTFNPSASSRFQSYFRQLTSHTASPSLDVRSGGGYDTQGSVRYRWSPGRQVDRSDARYWGGVDESVDDAGRVLCGAFSLTKQSNDVI